LVLKAPKPKPAVYPAVLETLGERLRARRLDLGLYQKDVAAIIGVSADTICYWENKRVKPSRRLSPLIKGFLDGVDKK
jgi:transcriptional regulator with XRE-family HTH domain